MTSRRAHESGDDGLAPYLALDAAVLAALDGEAKRAATLAGAARAAFTASGQIPDPDDAAEWAGLHARLIEILGQHGFESAYEAGAQNRG